MRTETYATEARMVMDHWWFVGRRRLFGRIIAKLGLSQTASILDIGTSSGTNLIMLRDLGFVRIAGLDASMEAIRWCAERGLPSVALGDICQMPFAANSVALVTATDILEHVEDDAGALAEVRRVLAPGGYLLTTVPAFTSLWGLQDDVSHHLRRYRMDEIVVKVNASGFEIAQKFYFNWLLFVPIWFARQVLRVLKPDIKSENDIGSPLINAILSAVFRFDIALAPRLHSPFGVSILILARKPVEP